MEGVWESAEGVLPSQVAALLAHHGATVDATAGLPSGTGAVAGLVVGVLLCINLVLLLIKFAGKAVKGTLTHATGRVLLRVEFIVQVGSDQCCVACRRLETAGLLHPA